MSRPRLLRLQPWLVRAAVPPGLVGTYVLHRAGHPNYVGRSDTDLQRRLVQHCASRRGDYFSFDIHPSQRVAFEVECSLFHALGDSLENVMHPDSPDYSAAKCPFCPTQLAEILTSRLTALPS